MNDKNKKIVIVGLGVTGISCVDYFLSHGIVPQVIDTRKIPPMCTRLDSRIEYYFGGLRADWLEDADLIVVSPGIALSVPALQKAAERGGEIIGDIELFCREINRKRDKKIIAITGVNGKTTVTTLVGQIAKAAGIKTAIGGNIGMPALSLLNADHDLYVLELSSFQLEITHSLHATVATILNVSEDHMDRYPLGIEQYAAAKQRIYRNASYCIINHDDPLTFPNADLCSRCIEFGLLDGDYSLNENYSHLLVKKKPVLATADIKVMGLHNYANVLVALAAADLLAIDRKISLPVIKQFTGLPHRFELVHEYNGVRWIDDSKATNVDSTKAALQSVICDGHLYLLLGGVGKQAKFQPLLPYLQRDNLSIYTFGQDANLLTRLRPQITTKVATMAQAIAQIARKIQSGDVVLLSPACASLDQFKNYIERGEKFRQLAKEFGV